MKMKFRTRLLLLNSVPVVVFAVIALASGLMLFRSSLFAEKEGNLRSTALAALTLYSSQGYGDYSRRDDGYVWRGMNMNISERTAIVDAIKQRTGIDITFYYGERAVMTSIMEADGKRAVGLAADENITSYILHDGKQLWCPKIFINGEECQAYVIPVRQETDGSVVGALMASQSVKGLHTTIRNYILTLIIPMLLVLFAVFLFIRWHVDWFVQKFAEVVDRSERDLLTGLYNKLTFENKSKDYLEQKRENETAVLLILDFDNFKHVNDTYGHQTGDYVLKAFSDILIREFRTEDIIGRVGGDEFMVLMQNMTVENVGRSDEIAADILEQLRALKVGEAGPFSCSIGIGAGFAACSFQDLYKLADEALYEAKERGKACFVRHTSFR